MTKTFLFNGCLLLWLATVAPVAASTDDPTRPILDASDKPFISFVDATIQVALPPLPPPGDKLSDPKLSQVRDLLWSRISLVDLNVNPANKKELVDMLTAMCSLRGWLLQHPVYSNLALTFKIDETAPFAVLAGLINGSITVEDAKRIMDSLNKNPPIDTLLLAAEGGVLKSKAIAEFKQKAGSESLSELSGELAEEQGEEVLFSDDPENYLKQIDPAVFIFHAAGSYYFRYTAELLVEYISRGGNVNLEGNDLKSDLEEKIPGIEGLTLPGSGDKLDWHKMEYLIKISRKWAATHSGG